MSETTLAVIDQPAAPAAVADSPAPVRAPLRRAARLLGTGVRRTVAIAAFLALWQIAPTLGWVDPAFLSPQVERAGPAGPDRGYRNVYPRIGILPR